jgi:hypothetical protein
VAHGSQCVLEGDLALTETLDLASGTHLNCLGHKLSASTVGTPDIAATSAAEYSPSVPEVAVLVNGARTIKIQNCLIEDFDFGILVANSKRAAVVAGSSDKILITGNTINSHYYGVRVLASDDVRVERNVISFARQARGKGVWVQGDSDYIDVVQNEVDGSTSIETVNVPLLPGGNRIYNVRADAIRFERAGVRDGTLFGIDFMNLIIDGHLYQYSYRGVDTAQVDPVDWMEHVVVAGNEIKAGVSSGTFTISFGGGLLAPVAVDNVIKGGGVHFSGPNFEAYAVASICSANPSRLCVSDRDCFIAGIDMASQGTCASTTQIVTHGVVDGLIAGNVVHGPFPGTPQFANSAISTFPNSVNAVIANNVVDHAVAAIYLFGAQPLGSALVSNNVVTSSSFALQLNRNGMFGGGAATSFSARIHHNDFVGSTTRAIAVVGAYALPTELSVDAQGNYWGRDCASGGFLASDSPVPSIRDSHPYGQPVALASPPLPVTCE